MSSQYVYTMHRLTKRFPPDKTVLDDLTLSFFPGAKIGVLGYNGAGKSTLLKIMAGLDDDYRGEAQLGANRDGRHARAGAAPRRVQGRQGQRRGRRRRDQGAARALQRARGQLLRARRRTSSPRLQAQIDAADAWSLDTQLEYAMDALRLPPADAEVANLSGGERRRVRALPAAAQRSRPAAARRADQPPRRRVRGLAGAAPGRLQGRRRRGDPRSLLPRQRRGLDPRARPRQGHPLRGQLLRLAGGQGEAPAAGGPPGQVAPAPDLGRARVGAHEPEGPPHEVQGAPRPLRGARQRGAAAEARGGRRSTSRRAPGWAGPSSRPTACARASATGC